MQTKQQYRFGGRREPGMERMALALQLLKAFDPHEERMGMLDEQIAQQRLAGAPMQRQQGRAELHQTQLRNQMLEGDIQQQALMQALMQQNMQRQQFGGEDPQMMAAMQQLLQQYMPQQ